MKRARLLLADDHMLVIEGIRKLLENDFDLVGTAGDGQALVRAAEQLRPDLILLDISMPVLNGLEACRQLLKILPDIRIIFPHHARRARLCGRSLALRSCRLPPEKVRCH